MTRIVLLLALLAPVSGLAETSAAAPTSVAAAQSSFEKAERLEALRYRHLWIAYAAIWFIVFGFTFKTWKRSEITASELDELKRRLADLEGRSNG